MKWSSLPEPVLLQRSFLFGITGILLGTLSLLNTKLQLLDAPMGPLNGVSLLLQFFGLGLAVIVLRRPKVAVEFKEKSQLMILILAVALLLQKKIGEFFSLLATFPLLPASTFLKVKPNVFTSPFLP